MPRYDLDLVKSAANGRWEDILVSLAAIPAECLDGSHHPCPKCGGTDRFRALDDFRETGGVICNQCFNSRNGDGLAALQWMTGLDFGKVLEKVARHCDVKAEKGRKKVEPTDKLEFLTWNRTAAFLWCEEKPPITVDALERLGAKFAKYLQRYTVIAIPVWGPQLDAEPAVGWIVYRSDGGELPKYKKGSDEPEWKKVLLTQGSQQGLIVPLDQWKNRPANATWWKLEGSTDLLTALSQDWPEGNCFFTTANGAMEKPLDWICHGLENEKVYVVHDCDKPGQEGATWVGQAEGRRRPGWCPVLAKSASEVRNVALPFAVEPTHGPDIRDYFNGGGSVATLLELAENSAAWASDAIAKEENQFTRFVRDFPLADGMEVDDPSHLASANREFYAQKYKRQLVFLGNECYRYKGTHYERLGMEHLKSRVRGFIENYLYEWWRLGKDDREKVRKVSRSLVDATVDSIKAKSMVPKSMELDSWMNDEHSDQCVALQNNILNLDELFKSDEERGEYLLDHTPNWFSLTCLPYECDLSASCPNWISFLSQVFEDPESIEAIQRWFGYLLLPDTSLQKMMFIIGPTRSGKGTMMKVMMGLFGRQSVASPTLNGLVDQYALHSMYGKSIAIIPDARLSRRADRETVTEKLLSLVANDPQDIQRKYLDTLNGIEMNLRFTLFSNKLPDLDDSTAAMAGRGIYLLMPNSFYGREDLGLQNRLLEELPGILNWAIVGRHKLIEDPVIRQPESSQHLVRQMRMVMAPVSQFFSECTRYSSTASGSLSSDVFELWCNWASENAYVHKMSITDFERKAIDANPSLRTKVVQLGGSTERKFLGLELLK